METNERINPKIYVTDPFKPLEGCHVGNNPLFVQGVMFLLNSN
jgi:hypothetical protein